jgi:hypothetical protein
MGRGSRLSQNDAFCRQGIFMKPRYLVVAALAAFASTAGAQSQKPGLWEITNKIQMDGERGQQMAQAQAQIAAMPPEQRKMMEEMMAKQGIKLGAGGPGGGISAKVCVTKEMAERAEMPVQQQGDCRSTQQPRAGNVIRVSFTCTNPPSSGEGQVTLLGPEAYSMKMTVNTVMQGKPERMNMDGTAKWLGSDCGNIKPPPMMKK